MKLSQGFFDKSHRQAFIIRDAHSCKVRASADNNSVPNRKLFYLLFGLRAKRFLNAVHADSNDDPIFTDKILRLWGEMKNRLSQNLFSRCNVAILLSGVFRSIFRADFLSHIYPIKRVLFSNTKKIISGPKN